MRLGIDFGTTRTVVASTDDGKHPICRFEWEGVFWDYIPSIVAVKLGNLQFGWDALSCLKDPHVYLLRSMKSLMAELRPDDYVQIAPGLSFSIMELVTRFLAYVKGMILQHSNLMPAENQPIEVMVATPATANNNQRYITMEAFQRAGFVVLGMMNEPSAASVEFVQRYLRNLGPRSPKKYVIVYDLGGGTFDTSVVALTGGNYEVIASEGIARLGGDDFDRIILEQVMQELGHDQRHLSPNEETRLLEECRERKEGIKPNTRKMVVDLGAITGQEKFIVIGTDKVYDRCEALIQSTLDAVRAVIMKLSIAGIDPEDSRSLAAVYLVGGSISFPIVSRRMKERYGNKIKVSPYPHAATAVGLAIAADPRNRVRIFESVSRHFGVWREHDKGRNKVFDPIFKKDTCLDQETHILRVTRRYYPVHNVGHLRYMECSSLGKSGEPQGDISLWKPVYFPYDPHLKNHKNLVRISIEEKPHLAAHEILETYSYDRKGMIRVEIANLTGGYKRVFTIEPTSQDSLVT